MELPFSFNKVAQAALDELENITFTFRVWGVDMSGDLCIEAFCRDARNEFPFSTQEFDEHSNGKVTAFIPKHHKEFIHGVVFDYWEDFDENNFDESKDFRHMGFHCQGLEKPTDELIFSNEEAASIILKQLRISCGVFDNDEHGIKWCKSILNLKDITDITTSDLHSIIGTCIQQIGPSEQFLR